MAVVPLPELERLARDLAGERHDTFSQRALGQAYEEFLARRRTPVGGFHLRVGEREYGSFYDVVADPAPLSSPLELRLDASAPGAASWEYLRPFSSLEFDSDGSAQLAGPTSPAPTRVIARFLLREHYLPRSRAEEDRAAAGGSRVALPTLLRNLPEGIGACRSRGLLPFCVAVLAYLPEERVIYELDLLRSLVLADPRAGRLTPSRRVRRTSRVSWYVDQATGRGEMPLLTARCLQVIVESHGLTSVEVAHVFGGVRELVDSALQGLAARGLVTFDRRTGVYRPRLDVFLPATSLAAGPSEPNPPNAHPALRTSVQELIAAADARATCPLCGSPVGADHRGLLCAKCAAEVDGA